jgi:membrane associated rhomboid family serine protease
LLPLRDENPSRTTPHVTRLVIAANVAIFLVTLVVGERGYVEILRNYALIPSFIMKGEAIHSLVTSMFLHGGIAHLAGNTLYLHIFGDNVEDACGHGRFIVFYLLCGTIAGVVDAFFTPNPNVPVVGASGAISGILGAYLVLYPRAMILTVIPFLGFIHIVRVPAILYLGFWFIFQYWAGTLMLVYGIPTGVAYWAHIGGFVAGIAFASLFRRSPRPLP